jgi:hypothetical protein
MMGGMRPPGVQHRIRQLLDDEWDAVHSRPERALRANLTDFIGLCARLRYWDHPVNTVLRRYRDTWRHLDDPRQVRTGTDFERRCITCMRELRPEIGHVADNVETASFDEQESVVDTLLQVPPRVVLGEVNPDSYYHLTCWNQANALVEGVQTPYRAARNISNMKIHEPPDVYGLIPPLTELAERYEDDPDARPATGEAIVDLLAAYLGRAPWPVA